MATHNVFLSGQRTVNANYAMFPATQSLSTDKIDIFSRTPGPYVAVRRTLDFNAGALVLNPNIPASISPETYGDAALVNYAKRNVIAAGDVLNIIECPKGTSLVKLFYHVIKTITPLTFDLSILGTGIGGAKTLVSAASGTTADVKAVYNVADTNGSVAAPVNMLFTANDMIQFKVDTCPANTVGADGFQSGGVFGLAIAVTGIFERYDFGAF